MEKFWGPEKQLSIVSAQLQTFLQAHREGGVAGANAPGPGGPKGARRAPSKKFNLV